MTISVVEYMDMQFILVAYMCACVIRVSAKVVGICHH